MCASLAPRSICAYTRAWANFVAFCSDHSTSPVPASPIVIAHYISDCYLKGLAYSTILSRVSVIAYVHKLKSIQDPTTNLVVRNVLKGLNRCASTVEMRSPITKSMLHTLCRSLDYVVSDVYHRVMCKAIFLLLWHLALRGSELCCTDGSQSNALQLGDVEFISQSKAIAARFNFKKYKHSHSPSILLVQSDDSPYVRWLH